MDARTSSGWARTFGRRIDTMFAWVAIAGAAVLAVVLATQSFARGWSQSWFVVLVYVVIAYLVLPRLHTALAAVYLPDYFIGRTRTREGILGDPVNIAFTGSGAQIHAVMRGAGWVLADDLALSTDLRIVASTVLRRSYPSAPVSNLYLFGERQHFCYQQEVGSSPGKRHHVRFWRVPEGWLLPGGRRVDWLAAATFDRGVGLSLFTWQVTHRIAQDIDVERDHVVDSIAGSARIERIENFSTGYHSRNGGGDSITTDGDLPVVDVRDVPVGASAVETASRTSGRVRPGELVTGVVLMAVRPVAGVLLVLGLLGQVGAEIGQGTAPAAVIAVVIAIAIVALGSWCVLAWRVWQGRPFARLIAMTLSAVAVVSISAAWFSGASRLTVEDGLAGFALDVAILFALSGREARRWTFGAKRRRASQRSSAHR